MYYAIIGAVGFILGAAAVSLPFAAAVSLANDDAKNEERRRKEINAMLGPLDTNC